MFVILRSFKVEKGFLDILSSNFLGNDALKNADGFVKMEYLKNDKNSEFDTCIFKIYWENKDAFSNYQKSPAHKDGHKNQKEDGVPKEILDNKIETYELAEEFRK